MKCNSFAPILSFIAVAGLIATASGCGKADVAVPTSSETASEIAASSVSGALASSEGSQGAMAMNTMTVQSHLLAWLDSLENKAYATTACPIMATSMASCVSGVLTLTYSSCQFQKANGDYNLPVWTGSQIITFSGGTCPASFSAIKTGNVTLTRTVGVGTTRTAANGNVVSFDTTTASGYSSPVSGGAQVVFSGGNGSRTITISGIHYVATKGYTDKNGAAQTATLWDHSVSTTAPLTYTQSTKTMTGTVQVQHNLAKYTASAAFSVTFDHSTCGCYPKSGTITTTLTGSKTGTETLTFTDCGTGTLTGSDGSASTITMSHCL